jgi:predicted kinase
MTQTLYLTRGLPASGKSTFARNVVEKSNGTILRLERDLLRDQLYSSRQYSAPADATEEEKAAFKQYLNDRENTITTVQRSMAEVAIKAGRSVVIADTNLRAKFAQDWQKFALAHGINFEVVDFDVSVEECIKRDQGRPNEVGEKVIRDMATRFLVKGKIPKLAPVVESSFSVEPYDNPDNLPKVVIVDIDGTLATMKNRSPYDWSRVGEDEPAKAVISAVHAAAQFNRRIIIMSGRDESCRKITEDWLTKHLGVSWHELHMRPEGDNRKDNIIKYELFNKYVRGKYQVDYVLDDRDQVVKMWRELGLACFQVNYGAF